MPSTTISEAEWHVMDAVWDRAPQTAQDIVAALGTQFDWAPATIKTMLHRLVKKGVLAYEQDGPRYIYRSRVKRAACVREEGRSFLQRVFHGEPTALLAHFLKSSRLSPDDIAELRRILDEQEAQ